MKLSVTWTFLVCALGAAILGTACRASPVTSPDAVAPASPVTEPALAPAPSGSGSSTPSAASADKAPALTCAPKACTEEAEKMQLELSQKLAEEGESAVDHGAEEARIEALFRRACDGKEPRACYEVFDRDRRSTTPPSPEKLAELLILSCGGNVGGACAFLADAYRDGKGVPKDHDKQVQALASACTLTIFTQCKLVHDLTKNPAEKVAVAAVAKWKKDCAAGDANACTSAKQK